MKTTNHKTQGVAPVGSSAVLGDSGGVIPINALSGVYDWLRHQKEMNERNHIFHPDFLDGNIRNIKELLDRARQLQAGIVPVKNADTGSLGVTAGKTSIYETLRRAVHRRFDGLLECLLLWCHKFRGVESPNDPKLSHADGRVAPQTR